MHGTISILFKFSTNTYLSTTNPLIYHKIHKVLVKNTFEGTDNGSYRLSVSLSVKQEAGDKETWGGVYVFKLLFATLYSELKKGGGQKAPPITSLF